MVGCMKVGENCRVKIYGNMDILVMKEKIFWFCGFIMFIVC